MPLDGGSNDLEADFELLEAIGAHVEAVIEDLVGRGAIQKTLRQWLAGHAPPPEDEGARACLMALAADLELFTPSMSGRTAIDRHVEKARPEDPLERQALAALSAATLRLIRVGDRDGPDTVSIDDLVTGERLCLIDARLSPLATGAASAMRLCPLPSGRFMLTSPLYMIDEAQLAEAMTFVRGGRPLGHGHRCAAHLYRSVARRGLALMPELITKLFEVDEDLPEDFTEVERLAVRWLAAGGPDASGELVADARRLASTDHLVDACGLFASLGLMQKTRDVFERIAELQVETLFERAKADGAESCEALRLAGEAIADFVARKKMHPQSQELFERLRARWEFAPTARRQHPAAAADLDRVIQRIRALREKTVERGCTEEEAMAAAAKVAELLDRHDLTLDAVSVREAACEGVHLDTGRKRRAPIDDCMAHVAAFCDCRVWMEAGHESLRWVFFGLKADVQAARFIHELIEQAFETESATFRRGDIYLASRGGDRRAALHGFQVGLARGIAEKLDALKAARGGVAAQRTGFDLVALKHAAVDEEIDRLGLNFTSRAAKARRVRADAYAAGKAAGSLFEPQAALRD